MLSGLFLCFCAGVPAEFTQTGGMYAALEARLEGNVSILLTDEDDTLSWDPREKQGWAVGLYDGDGGDAPVVFASDPRNETEVLLKLVDRVLRSYMKIKVNMGATPTA
jgi:hypothetical protein